MTRHLVAACAAAFAMLAGAASASASNDPLYPAQWGLEQVRAPQAWPTSTGNTMIIGVVDSGVDLDHPDLAGKLLPGATFLDCEGDGSCGNGDWESGPEERQESKSTHGTHVAGIAAATTDNGIGVAGTAPDAQIIPVKALDEEGGSYPDIAKGIRYAVDNGADVVNLSLGSLPGIQLLVITGIESDVTEAIAYAREKGALVVAAAGNEYVAPFCDDPGFDEAALCVVATDKNENRAEYSNFALKPGQHSVAAPGGSGAEECGENIVSTVPVGTSESECGYGGDYDEMAGTSMSTPFVSGVGALLMAQGRSDDDTLRILEETARDPGSDERGTFDPVYGYGIVDAAAAVGTPGATQAGTPTQRDAGSSGGAPAPATASGPSPNAAPPAQRAASRRKKARKRKACKTRRKAQRGRALAKGHYKGKRRGKGKRTRRCARRR